MAVILADGIGSAVNGFYVNSLLTGQLNQFAVDYWPFRYHDIGLLSATPSEYPLIASALPVSANGRVIGVDLPGSYFDDFYYAVHVIPQSIDLKTIASPQTRTFRVWNAYPDLAANMTAITIDNPVGVSLAGQTAPYSMPPLKELQYSVTVGTNGPAKADINVLYDFSNVLDPFPLEITGTRAVQFGVMPDVPVTEKWDFLTDVQVAEDGTELRVALRGEYPRVSNSFKALFLSNAEVTDFATKLLTCVGRLWVPEYQYATPTTAASALGAITLNFDRGRTDVRVGEYALVVAGANKALCEIKTLETYGATISSPLEFAVPKDSLIVPGSPCFLADQSSLDRYAVNDAGETMLDCKFNRYRDTLIRPGSTVTLPTFLGDVICDKRPLAKSAVPDAVSTGQELVDNNVGQLELISNWDYSRVGGPREFKVDRVSDPVQMDYWRAVMANARGRARKFWMPTYRNDLVLAAGTTPGASSFNVLGTEYLERTFIVPTHRYMEIETTAGKHYASITGATQIGGNTAVAFTPALPAGAGWGDVTRISLLLPIRLADDSVTWKHYALESMLSFSIRTAEP